MAADVDANLQEVAASFGLSILAVGDADQALRAVASLRPGLIIVQVSQLVNETLNFIRLATRLPHPAPLIAVATSHTEQIERDVWHAGAAWYVPNTGPPLLNRVLTAVLP